MVNLSVNYINWFLSRNRYWVLWLAFQIPLIRWFCFVVQCSSNRNFEITKFYHFTNHFTRKYETQNQSSNRRIFSTLIRPSAPSCSGALITREWLLRPPHPAINQVPGIRPANRLGRGTLLAASSARGNEGVRSPPPTLEVLGGGGKVGGGTCFTLRASVKILLKMLVKFLGECEGRNEIIRKESYPSIVFCYKWLFGMDNNLLDLYMVIGDFFSLNPTMSKIYSTI